MASIVPKKKGNKTYYYAVQSARVNGKPRIIHQDYLGTAEKIAALVKDRSAPVPLTATIREFGLSGSLWLAAKQSGVFELLLSLWPQPRSGPSPAHYLLLAAIHRICEPGPKTEVQDWYEQTALPAVWHFPSERFTSQAFWDCFESILPAGASSQPSILPAGASLQPDDADPLDRAQSRLLDLWKQRQPANHRLLAYDTTNFYTYIATTNDRASLPQRGHNKQGRHNLRQVGLSYLLDGENGISMCHHVYSGEICDADEFSVALERICRMLDENKIERESVTLVFDKGSASLPNTVELEKSRTGWISALPWNQAPEQLRSRAVEKLTLCSSNLPGVRATAEKILVHGKEYLCVIKYSSSFAGEQIQSLATSMAKALQSLRRLSIELTKPKSRYTEAGIRAKIGKLLSAQFLDELIQYQLEHRDGCWRLQYDLAPRGFENLIQQRLGRTVLITNRMDWTAEQVAAGYGGQQHIEKVFRGLKDGHWLGWGPMFHWTDRKIRIHAFYCMLGISLLQYLHKQAQGAWNGITIESLLNELKEIRQVVLLYPPQGDKGPLRSATVLTKQSLAQQELAKSLGLDQLFERPRRR
jgi:transposase